MIRAFRFCLWLCWFAMFLAASANADTRNFQFVLLSDTHVGSETGAEDLRAAVRDINTLTNVEFVLLSGDVTEYGSREFLQLAREILGGLKVPLHIGPGNHDMKWSESGATDFAKIFGDERFNFEFGGYRFLGMHQGPLMKMGDGFWSPQDVRWLKETLAQMPDAQQPIIFVTHYPLNDGIANWYEVLDLLKKYNTQVVLCGHGHANRTFSFEDVAGVMGRSNLRARRATGGFNIVEIKDGKITFTEHLHGGGNKPWHTNVLVKHEYATDTTKYPRPDFSVNAQYPKVKPRWKFNTGFTIASSPAVSKDLAIVGDASGTVYAFALADGATKWKFITKGPVYSTPDVNGERVVFASTDGNIYCLNAGSGKELWRFTTDRALVACPLIVGETVFIGSSEGVFRALNLNDGKNQWSFDGAPGFVETRPLHYDGKIIFGAWDQHLYALDAKTGTLTWKWKGDRPGTLYSPAACWPVAAHGKVFIAAPDRKVTALDAKTGNQIWRSGDHEGRESIALSADGSRFYVRSMNNRIYAISTLSDKPENVWELNAQFGYDINSAMLAEKDGVLFYGTKNDLLLAIDAATGKLKWQHKLGTGVMNTVVPLSATEVLTTDFSGQVALVVSE
ncbi:MAG TPA: PQQ-binding-like beta-propeller repeat protein [Verrucomicrobiae bacterium]|nr:PQQ-binding-like beta-propeller repeat protein [Verrucomicrobiae bacterium]